MAERRATERRRSTKRMKRGGERRGADRRDSPRVPMVFLTRPAGSKGAWDLNEGNLSIGGISWTGVTPPHSRNVEIRFRLPGIGKEVKAFGEVLRLRNAERNLASHVRFTYLDVESELAIARYLHER